MLKLQRITQIIWLLLAIVYASSTQAQTVSAEFNPNPIATGDTGSFTIIIDGGITEDTLEPPLPNGLSTTGRAQTSQQMQIINGKQSISMSMTWPVVASAAGTYTIPAIPIRVNGQNLSTLAVTVTVADNPSRQQQRQALEPLLRLIPGKTEFYIGEMVPVSAKIYVPSRVQVQQIGLIETEKQDLAIQRFPTRPQENQVQIDNRNYTELALSSVMSALVPGKVKLGPAKTKMIIATPSHDNRFGFFGSMLEQREIQLEAPAVTVNVLPLPTEGKPKNFSGAVGQFTFVASTDTTTAKVGEPLTIDLSIKGSGNFDAIQAPTMLTRENWKQYPPKRYNVDANDPNRANLIQRHVGFSITLVAEQPATEIPAFEFCYFDPNNRQYINQRSQPLQVSITGSTEAPATPPLTANNSTAAAPDASMPVLEPQLTDILTVLPTTPRIAQIRSPWFKDWLVITFNALGFTLLIGWLLQLYFSSRKSVAKHSPELKRRSLWAGLQEANLHEAEFYKRVGHYLQQLGLTHSPELKSILERYEALCFSGSSTTEQPISSSDRQSVLNNLEKLRPAPGSPLLRLSLILIGWLIISSTVSAENIEQNYTQAIQALEAGKYDTTKSLAQKMIQEDQAISPEVFSLIGHAHYKQNQPGLAAVWYQRAWLLPGASHELRQNLRHVSEKLNFMRPDWDTPFTYISLKLSKRSWVLLASVGVWLAVLATWLLVHRKHGWLRLVMSLLIFSGVILLSVGTAGAVLRPSYSDVENLAFVTGSKADVRSAATVISGQVMSIPTGSMVKVLEKRGDWTYVETFTLPGQNHELTEVLRGWVKAELLEAVWPYAAELLP